jgi:hypothetical protein
MTPIPNARYERKFVTDRLSLAEALSLVRRHHACFREAYPPRIVNNIYLDSPGLSDFQAHVTGAPNRKKTRVRWYGPPSGKGASPALERKFKHGLLSGKTTRTLPDFILNGQGLRPALEDAFNKAELPESSRLDLQLLEPALFNRYLRFYFVSGDGACRLTVDSDIQFGLPRTESVVNKLSSGPWIVLELKFRHDCVDQAARITNALPFRMARCSKYVLGIRSLSSQKL